MPSLTHTYTFEQLKNLTDITVVDFGEQALAQALTAELNAHSRAFNDMSAALMETTTERIVSYGINQDSGELVELDELSRTPTRGVEEGGGTFNLPLRRYGDALGWTRDYLRDTTVGALANQVQAIENKDIRTMFTAIRKALFVPTNYTVRDFTVVGRDNLNIVRLVNGDGMAIPNSPEATSFDAATHTHYLANSGWSNEAINGAIDTVREHGHRGNIRIYINATNRANIQGISGTKYVPFQAPELSYGADLTVARGVLNNDLPEDNREIGVWDGLYRVATKPWVPAGYVFVYDTSGPKPLAMRVPERAELQGLRLVFQFDDYPLRADGYEHRFGVGVRQRTNGAIVYLGGGTYTAPAGLS